MFCKRLSLLDYVERETSYIIVLNITGKVTVFWAVMPSCLVGTDKNSVERTAFYSTCRWKRQGFSKSKYVHIESDTKNGNF